jgi:hypothetical protein
MSMLFETGSKKSAFTAVELVAEDWVPHVGHVQPQLVRAARHGR